MKKDKDKKVGIIIVIVFLVISFTGVLGYYYIMYGGARNLSTEDTTFTITSKNIVSEFESNIEKSNKKYLEKAIVISGTITEISGKQIIIDNTIICELKDLDTSIQKNQAVAVKGRVVGYDDLMGELKLDQCLVLN